MAHNKSNKRDTELLKLHKRIEELSRQVLEKGPAPDFWEQFLADPLDAYKDTLLYLSTLVGKDVHKHDYEEDEVHTIFQHLDEFRELVNFGKKDS